MTNKPSITTNFIFNILLTLSTYIAQLVVYPYVSRVLGVDHMGIIGFVNKTIDIFLIFSTLGIQTVGIREIAAAKNNKRQLDQVFSDLVSFTIVSTLIVSIVYLGAILWVTKFNIHSNLFLIGISKLVFSTFLIEWFYQGIEDFKFITIRSVGIKILYIISVFLFVKKSEDYIIYFALTTSVVVLNSLVNWIFSHKYVNFKFGISGVKPFVTPMFTFGAYHMLNAFFSTFNYLFLGFIATNTEVGYYYTAENFYFILLAAISAFTRVMLPRMSSLLSMGKKEEFNDMIIKSFNVVLVVCLPIVIYGVSFSKGIVSLFSGAGYEGAVIPLQIMMALLLINSINQILIVQVATPLKLDKEILIGTVMATIVALSANYFAIKFYGAIGCSVVLVLSVIIANSYPIYKLYEGKYIEFPMRVIFKQMLLSLPYILISILVILFGSSNSIVTMLVAAGFFGLYFVLVPGHLYIANYWKRLFKKIDKK